MRGLSHTCWSLSVLRARMEHTRPQLSMLEAGQAKAGTGPSHRASTVEWIHEVTDYFLLSSETACFAVNFLDRVMSRRRVFPHQLQLLATSCVLLAAKLNENAIPTFQQLAGLDDSHSVKVCTLRRMERVVLRELEWDLLAVTPHMYLHHIAEAFSDTKTRRKLLNAAECFVDLSTCSQSLLEYSPLVIAASCMLSSLELRGENVDRNEWAEFLVSQLCDGGSIDVDVLLRCHAELSRLHKMLVSPDENKTQTTGGTRSPPTVLCPHAFSTVDGDSVL